MLMLMTNPLAAYQIRHAHALRQLHTNEATHHQTSLVNVIILDLTYDVSFKTICHEGGTIAKDGTAES